MNEKERPVVVQVHRDLIEELKIKKQKFLKELGTKTRGGITTFSKLAAYELKLLRKSSEQIEKEIVNHDKNIKVERINGKDYVPYEFYKKLFIYTSVLYKKKDQPSIKLDVSKLKGLKKNEIIFY